MSFNHSHLGSFKKPGSINETRLPMKMLVRTSFLVLTAASMLVTAAAAQTKGEAIYKAKCLTCHGPTGMGESPVGKAMHVKPISDPAVKKMNLDDMIEIVKKGMGKMQPYKDVLSEADLKDSVVYFRGFLKP